MEDVRKDLLNLEAYYKVKAKNIEASQPPAYYLLAGAWWRLGKLLKMDGLPLLYWLRFLNILIVPIIAWLGWITARGIFPENKFISVAVAAIIAFMPQTVFYSVTNDILSPVAFGAAFLLLLRFAEADMTDLRLAALSGVALAATYLVKTSNLPLVAAAGTLLGLLAIQAGGKKKLDASLPSLFILAACAGIPIITWMIWCQFSFGDPIGSGQKISLLHWTAKPVVEWLNHPLFTLHGFWIFLTGNISTFWQGEFLWHGQPMAIPEMNYFYVMLTLTILFFTAFASLKPVVKLSSIQQLAIWFAFSCMALSLVFFALLSVRYDFHDCFYPSREHPYFTSGRLMLGLLIPFLVLFAYGFDFALKKFNAKLKFIALATLLAFMLASEIAADRAIFPSEFNWFHN